MSRLLIANLRGEKISDLYDPVVQSSDGNKLRDREQRRGM